MRVVAIGPDFNANITIRSYPWCIRSNLACSLSLEAEAGEDVQVQQVEHDVANQETQRNVLKPPCVTNRDRKQGLVIDNLGSIVDNHAPKAGKITGKLYD